MSFFEALDPKYRLILCDIWGVVHDGVRLYEGSAERLRQWRRDGRCVCLITNAPRTAEAVEQQLARLELPRDAYDYVATSGEAGIDGLRKLGHPVGFLGTPADRGIIEGRGIRLAVDGKFTDVACTGLREEQPDPESYRAELERWAGGDIRLHCLNPDRVVVRGGNLEACAGALADIYEELGGTVCWYGKPHQPIYEHALTRAGNPPVDHVLAVGDGLQTDILGAALMGFDAVFVTGGIHRGEAFPATFAAANHLGEWVPVAVVDGLDSGGR